VLHLFTKGGRVVKFAKIRTQMMSYYIVLLLVSMLISGVLYQRMNQNLAESKIGELSLQTLYAIRFSLQSLFDNTNKYSQRIIANGTVQEVLQTNLKDYAIVDSNQKIQKVMNGIFLAEPTIPSVYLFRNDDIYFSFDILNLGINVASIRNAPWYKEVVDKNGSLIWRTNSGGILNQHPNGDNHISLIRTVNDLVTAKQLGILIVNVPLTEIKKSYERAVSENKIDLMVTWGQESLIPFSDPELREYAESNDFRMRPSGTFMNTLSGKVYLFATTESDGWQYAIALPINEWSNPYKPINRVLVPIALLNFLFIFLGSIWISRSITRPLLSLLKSMRRAEAGEFGQVQLSGRSEEIRQLQDRYNSMISTIEQSMIREKEEQRTRRKLELDILQQQIKPHFLYNSLESVGYLSLTGEREESYRLITALADYYRQSLSKGNEVITLKQEFDITQNYLTIQNMRYPSLFTVIYELEERLYDYPIPKLTLQPLVENALYHGIRPMGQAGTIKIKAAASEKHVRLTIEDDGVGIAEEKLETIKDGCLDVNSSSFGLRGTITRLKLYYGEDLRYSIFSSPGKGSIVTIILPMQQEFN
jgi:two-component system sensor histidine kinase YesM